MRIYQEYALHAQAPDACCALTHALHALAPDACCALTRTGAPLPSLLCGTRPACSRLGRRQPARARACPLHRLGGQCGQPCGAPGGWCGRTRSAPPSHTPGFVCTCAPPPSPLGGAARARQAAQPQLFQCLQVRTGPAPGSTGSQAAGSGRRQGHAWDRRGIGLGLRLRKAARQAHRGQRLGDVHRVGVAHDEQLGARRGGHPPHGLQRARALELTFMLWTLSCWPRRQARFPASRHAPRRSGRGPLARLLRSMALSATAQVRKRRQHRLTQPSAQLAEAGPQADNPCAPTSTACHRKRPAAAEAVLVRGAAHAEGGTQPSN